MAMLAAKPGAVARPVSAPRATTPNASIYSVMGKMFAILSLRGDEYVILKCDPELVPLLRAQYAGIGHRSHLDKRSWIAVSLDADVPRKETERLVDLSYELVVSGLTRKQRAELESKTPSKAHSKNRRLPRETPK